VTLLRRELGSPPTLVAHLLRDQQVGWLAVRGESQPPPSGALPIPEAWSDDLAFAALTHLPAWRVVEAARLELGSRVRIGGQGFLRGLLEDLVRRHGALPTDARLGADAVLLVGPAAGQVDEALRSCRDGGSVVLMIEAREPLSLDLYPDVHRRALRLTVLSPDEAPADWMRARSELAFLLAGNVTPGA